MIQCQEITNTNVYEMMIDGNITEEEYDDLLESLTSMIDRYGKVRLLKVIHSLGDFPTIPVSRIWEDLKFGVEHFRDISHVAVVSDENWLESMVKAINPFLKPEVHHFPLSAIEDARRWLIESE